MKKYIINIFHNKTNTFAIPPFSYSGDLKTAQQYSVSVANSKNLIDCTIYIYDHYGFEKGHKFITAFKYQ
mgnify:CR=1 FL=1|jgi:hypothetical protein